MTAARATGSQPGAPGGLAEGAGTVCSVCRAALQAGNGSGRCYECQRAHRSARHCACGCGRPVGHRNTSGYARGCFLRHAWAAARKSETTKSSTFNPTISVARMVPGDTK